MKRRMIDAKRVRRVMLAAACVCTAMTAYGQQSAAHVRVGDATRAWLALQGGNEGAPTLSVLGAEASLAYQRYLGSFKTQIPQKYGSMMDGGMSGGNGGSHGGDSNSGAASALPAGSD